ncbi:tetratricopeptide repeat protein 39C-like [Ptychodera flava]|uniref:tetratricopeptide repeat protein 39C-like n=1 Tax=Ptychodera flava TaxID=63121 RepID=UPI00396A3C9F
MMTEDTQEYVKNGLQDVEIDDVKLSLAGINLMLNNGFKESDALFTKYRNYSPLMSAGASFVSFMQALMTFEDEKMEQAHQSLKSTEKLCSTNEGLISSMKKFFGSSSNRGNEVVLTKEERITRQIIIADCQLYMAMLTFAKQELSSYIKGGWQLRKAWKIYEKIFKEINSVTRKRRGIPESPSFDKPPAADVETAEEVTGGEELAAEASSPEEVVQLKSSENDIPDETLARLRGAVCFGYGLFQLCVSMMPPSLLKLVNLLGFSGDRDTGLKCLDESSHSQDMKAPLATLGLLWYHTVVRPFFALDGGAIDAGLQEATDILEENQTNFPTSALFLFYRGRIQRLKCQLQEALTTYNNALEACKEQREIQLICLYEIGWIHLMKLNWEESLMAFIRLREESRWSQCYYAYLLGICQGALGQLETAQEIFREVPKLSKKRNNQLEQFVVRKAEKFKKKVPERQHMVLSAIEVLYLWRALPTCDKEDLLKMLQECQNPVSSNLNGLKLLLQGAVHKTLGNREAAMQCFEDAMSLARSSQQESHVAPFACYELGTSLAEKPETFQRGKRLLIQAKDHYKDYDFDHRLHVRVHAALQQMKKMD